MKYKILTLMLLAISSTAFAENIDLNKELAPKIKQSNPDEVRSYQSEYGATITEYKSSGKVWMIKVQPAGDFPPYYLYDNEGDGEFERRVAGNKRPSPPMWIIKSF
ncbi:MAG: DUF2782 domain-containing protein [Ghiorsea sp.]